MRYIGTNRSGDRKELKKDERIACLAPRHVSFIRGEVRQVLQGV